MTLEQEKNLQNLLKQWRDERHLTVENQREGLIGNLFEEMTEYYRATNENKKIDALCDIYVFCMNSLGCDMKRAREKTIIIMDSKNKFLLLNFINDNLEGTKKEDNYFDEIGLNESLYTFMQCSEIEAIELGYNFYQCMLETIKEISSRTGYYDDNIHKFVKDTSPKAKAKWYKANYSKCKI